MSLVGNGRAGLSEILRISREDAAEQRERAEAAERKLALVRDGLNSLRAECVMGGAEAGDRRYRARSNNDQITEDARRAVYNEFGDRLQLIVVALETKDGE